MALGTPEAAARVRLVQLTPGLAGVVLTILLVVLARSVASLLLLLFLSILLGVFLDALRDFLVSRARLGPRMAFVAAIAITVVALGGVAALLVPPVVEQTRALIDRLPDFAVAWQERLERLVERFPAIEPFVGRDRQSELITTAVHEAESFVGGLLPRVFGLVHGFINVVSVLVMGLYLALQHETYEEFLVSVTPPGYRAAARDVLQALGETLRAWTLAQLLAMAVLGVLTAVGLRLLGVPYWLAFGIFTGAAAIVPFFGTLVSTLLPALFVIGGEGGLFDAFLVLVLGIVVHLVEANFVAPLIMARGVKLPPVFSIMAVLIAGRLLGPVGLLVAVPMLAVLMVLIRKVLIERVYGDRGSTVERRLDEELALDPSSPTSAASKGPPGEA